MADSAPPSPRAFDLRDLRRHWLVWIAPGAHADIRRQVTDDAVRNAVDAFLDARWPLVVRRQSDTDGEGDAMSRSIAVGMSLPPSKEKRRLAFSIAPEWIDRASPPIRLEDAVPRLPIEWRSPLAQLVRDGDNLGIEFRVYGSAAWAAITGLRYLGPGSDFDLLWRPLNRAQLDAGIGMLEAWEARGGLVADGEICFGDDAAVAWREWKAAANGEGRVLVKTLRGASLRPCRDLAALIDALPTARLLSAIQRVGQSKATSA